MRLRNSSSSLATCIRMSEQLFNRCCIVVVIDKSSYVNSVYPCVHAWVSVCEEIKVKA